MRIHDRTETGKGTFCCSEGNYDGRRQQLGDFRWALGRVIGDWRKRRPKQLRDMLPPSGVVELIDARPKRPKFRSVFGSCQQRCRVKSCSFS